MQASCWPISISNECMPVDLGMFSFLVGCRFVRQWWWVMFRTLWGAAILRARGSWVRGVVSFWKRTLVSRMKVYCSFTSLNLALRTCNHFEKRELLVFWSPRCSSGRGLLNDLFQTGLPLTTYTAVDRATVRKPFVFRYTWVKMRHVFNAILYSKLYLESTLKPLYPLSYVCGS